jgi:uncharacterized protein (DUF1697 family)
MRIWIAFLKGINVGGNNKIRMKDLVEEFQTLGFSEVRTYIQSGNVVFQHNRGNAKSLSTLISTAIQSRFGISSQTIILSTQDLDRAIGANPFPEIQSDLEAKFLHLYFLARPSTKFDQIRLDAIKRPSERWTFKDNVFYLHTPEGSGDSKLATQIEKIVGAPATARNLRTVLAIQNLALK